MEDTIAAISTSTVSSGGISIVRISGPDAIIIGDKVFKSKKNIKLANVQSHTVHFGNICDNGNEIDEALVIVMKAPNTYTRENIVEIDCHGGILVTKKVLEAVLNAGARLAEPGEFTYDTSTESSIFSGNLGESIKETFKTVGKRFTYGGDTGKDQRIYYFNTKEILENRFGTANPVPFRVVDSKIGLDIDVSIRCSGVYSYKIVDPLLFYSNVCGNVEQEYSREELDSTLKTEFISALQPAFGRLSEMELRPNQIVTHNTDLENAMNTALSEKWGALRGLKVVSIALGSVTLPDEDAELIKQAQRTAIMRDPTMAAATLVGAQADAMKTAAGNEAGAMTGFMGMGMAMNAAGGGMNAQNLFAMGQQQQAQQAAQTPQPTPAPQAAPAAGGWKCACGTTVTGNFCPNCGTKRPAEDEGWTCSCGAVNKGKFCTNCGAKKPAGAPLYRCDKCGWEPEDPKNPPRFCPECGDIFDENDRQ